MANFSNNDISDAKKRVEEMRKRAQDYIDDTPIDDTKEKDNNQNLFGDIKNIFSFDESSSVLLAIIMILYKEGADSKLIFALLYILL